MAKPNPKTRTPKRARILAVSTLYSHCREDKENSYSTYIRVPYIRIRGA